VICRAAAAADQRQPELTIVLIMAAAGLVHRAPTPLVSSWRVAPPASRSSACVCARRERIASGRQLMIESALLRAGGPGCATSHVGDAARGGYQTAEQLFQSRSHSFSM
jgi:hypothetical protein